jgi:aspartate dehydrogenase
MKPLKLGLAGLGAIGLPVARRVDAGDVPGITLAAVSVRDAAKARKATAGFRQPPPIVGLAELAQAADVIVECLSPKHFLDVAEPAVARGRIFMPLSVGALIDHMSLVEQARATGARIVVPTGALLGLDAVRATAEGKIASALIVTRKPPAGLAGAPLLAAKACRWTTSRRRSRCLPARRGRQSRAFPPMSTWRSPCPSPESARTARGWKCGPTPP